MPHEADGQLLWDLTHAIKDREQVKYELIVEMRFRRPKLTLTSYSLKRAGSAA